MNAKEFMKRMADGSLKKEMEARGTKCAGCGKPLPHEDPDEVHVIRGRSPQTDRYPSGRLVNPDHKLRH
jgi:hypothetical protein